MQVKSADNVFRLSNVLRVSQSFLRCHDTTELAPLIFTGTRLGAVRTFLIVLGRHFRCLDEAS